MFTGIVEELGTVVATEELADSVRLRIHGALVTSDAVHGDSIAVNGVCLTVVDHGDDEFTADVMRETLDRSSLGALEVGSRVNLERPVTLESRLGGHLVQGHVDGTGDDPRAHARASTGRSCASRCPTTSAATSSRRARSRSTASRSPSSTPTRDSFTVSLIPTTLGLTTLGAKTVGDPVNLEVDVVAKYVERMLQWRTS